MVSKIGPKGQVVFKKRLRDKVGMKEGMLVEERLVSGGILVSPVDARKVLEGWEETSRALTRKWPKGLSAVEAIRRERI